MSGGRVIRKLTQHGGGDDLAIAMVIEEGDLVGGDHGTEPVIILDSTETGRRLWVWAQREGKRFVFSPAAFGQPAGIKALRLNELTKVAQEFRPAPIPKDHCIVSINGIAVILKNEDLYVVSV